MNLFDQTRQLHQDGNFEQALAGYQTMLSEEPDHPQLCYLLALLYFEHGKQDEAAHWFGRTVELAPEAAPAHYNLGVIFFEQGNYDKAAKAYQEAATLCPEDEDVLFNLALAWKKLDKLEEALSCYQKILALSPDDQDTLYNLGVLYKDMNRPAESITTFEEVLSHNQEHAQSLNNLGYLYHKEGDDKKAISTYKKLIDLDHNAAMAAHMLAALSGETPATAPDAYVRDVFDSFSDHYDDSLVDKLGYTTPTLLKEMLSSHGVRHFPSALDMGCGTGLSGEAFHDITGHISGLDLSPKMLDLAAKKNIYHSLHESDICSFLQEHRESYDLFLAADVFVYIGDLDDIFGLVKKRAHKNALFLFSTELTDQDFSLKPTGRYGHAESYIRHLATKNGFALIDVRGANIRKEKGEWIAGNLYMLQA